MLEFNRLRIEQGDGSTAVDYRIVGERVESRGVTDGIPETSWHRLAPEKLRSHVMAGTVLSRWLRRRMGIHQLVRACQQDPPFFPGREMLAESEEESLAA